MAGIWMSISTTSNDHFRSFLRHFDGWPAETPGLPVGFLTLFAESSISWRKDALQLMDLIGGTFIV